MNAVQLGFAGDLVQSAELDRFSSYFGGRPSFASSQAFFQCEKALCGVCGSRLALVAQVYCPLDYAAVGRDLPDRLLYLFGCLKPKCGKLPACWRALRCQVPVAERPQSCCTAVSQPTQCSGTGANAWEDCWDGLQDNVSGSAFDFSDLNAAFDGAALHPHNCMQAASSTRAKNLTYIMDEPSHSTDNAGPPGSSSLFVWDGPVCFPAFYIVFEAESDVKRQTDSIMGRANELMALYQTDSKVEDSKCESEVDLGPEQYEADSARGVPQSYLKFYKRLQVNPAQCLRYAHRALPLWPSKEKPAPPPCGQCGGARVFEFQLMPACIHLAMEAADMHSEKGQLVDAEVRACLSEWDWLTIAVFTCTKSCDNIPSEASNIVEHVELAFEEDRDVLGALHDDFAVQRKL